MSQENIIALTMPKWGLSMKEGKFVTWLIEEGNDFNKGDELAEVETEKIASAVEASMSGVLRKKVAEEDTVYPVGALLAVVADESVSDADVDQFIEKFLADFVPPEDDDEEAENLNEYTEVNGTNLRYVSKGEGDQTILLLHGFGGDLGNWLFNQDDLVAKAGARVIAVDLPGHGQSSKQVGDGSLATIADQMIGMLDNLDIKQAHLVGHSMAGAVILQMLSTNADRVSSATLVSPAGLGTEINMDYISGFIECNTRKSIKPVLQLLFADAELVNRQLINGILQYKRLDGVENALNVISGSFLKDGKQYQLYDDILKAHADKISVIWGAHDKIIPVSHAEKWADTVDTLIIDSSGHMSHLEASSQVNDVITKQVTA